MEKLISLHNVALTNVVIKTRPWIATSFGTVLMKDLVGVDTAVEESIWPWLLFQKYKEPVCSNHRSRSNPYAPMRLNRTTAPYRINMAECAKCKQRDSWTTPTVRRMATAALVLYTTRSILRKNEMMRKAVDKIEHSVCFLIPGLADAIFIGVVTLVSLGVGRLEDEMFSQLHDYVMDRINADIRFK
jgi:hypothetical protein